MDIINGTPVKKLTASSSGIVYAKNSDFNQSPTEFAYGTWEFWMKQTSAADCVVSIVDALTTSTGYYITFGVTTRNIQLREYSTGSPGTILYTSPNASFSATEWFKFKMTRSNIGVFTLYVNDIILPAGIAGTNPSTDNTHTTANFISISLPASNATMFSLGSVKGAYSFIKKLL